MLIFTGQLIYCLPLDTWSVKIMWITAWIAMLAGSNILYKNMKGLGRKAAGLWIAATVFGIMASPLEILGSLSQGLLSAGGSGTSSGGLEGLSFLQSFQDWFLSLSFLLYLAGTLVFLLFPPFARMRTGWVWLSVGFVMSLLGLPPLLAFLPLFIGFYYVITRLYEDRQARIRAGAMLWMTVGLLLSLLILLDNDMKYILWSVAGLIFWFVGVNKMRSTVYEKRGTAAFLWYGVLMLVASVLHVLPGMIGDILALLFQLPAYILLAVGFFRFSHTNVFYGGTGPKGMPGIGWTVIFVILLSLIYLIPLVGEPLSALGVALVVVPVLTVGWKNGLSAQPDSEIEFAGESAGLQLGAMVRKYKFGIGVLAIIFIAGGIAYHVVARTLPERLLAEASELAREQGGWRKMMDPDIPGIANNVRKAAWLGNAEARVYRLQTVAQLDEIYRKAEWGDAYAQYAIGYFLYHSGHVINRLRAQQEAYPKNEWEKWFAGNRKEKSEADKFIDWYYKYCPEFRGGDDKLIHHEIYRWMLKAADKKHPRALDIISKYADRFEWHQAAAEQGSATAQYYLGRAYEYGIKGTNKEDRDLAYSWYLKSAKNGCAQAQCRIGRCFYIGWLGQEKDEKEAFRWLKKAAGNGCKEAYSYLGHFYMKGIGVTQNLGKALEYFRKSGNDAGINYCLGLCYELGENGMEQDYVKAVDCYVKGGDYGGEKLNGSEESMTLLLKAAGQGSEIAFLRLGNKYYEDENYEEAIPWLQKAAERGNAEAIKNLGVCYYFGYGVKVDRHKAVDCFRSAAEKGDETAKYFLGAVYYSGEKGVVKQDYVTAFKWFKESKKVHSAYMVGICYRDGKGVKRNRQEAKRWLEIAADYGDEDAKTALSKLH